MGRSRGPTRPYLRLAVCFRRDLAAPRNAVLAGPDRTEQSVFGFGGKDVQPEALGDLPAHPDTPDAVAVRIESRREDGYSSLTGYDRHDATAHAALGGDAYVERPLTR